MALARPTRSSTALAVLAALRSSGARLPWPAPGLRVLAPYLLPIAVLESWRSLRRRRPESAGLAGLAGITVALALLRRAQRGPQVAAPDSRVLRIISANVLEGRASVTALADLIAAEQPDVLLLQEADQEFRARLSAAGAAAGLPQAVEAESTALWSRWPLDDPRALALEHRAESVEASLRIAGGRPVPVRSLHPWPPVVPADVGPWQRHLASLPGPGPGSPLEGGIIAGDFNASLDQPELRAVLRRGWTDAAASVGKGLWPTFRAGLWWGTIDHVLVPPGAVVTDYRTRAIPGSDHRALVVTVALMP